MPLLKKGKVIQDRWLTIAGDEDLPIDVPVIVELERFQSERDELLRRNAPLGIRLHSDQPPSEIAEDLDRFDVVALEFPKFTDGRAYSHARQLRDRYHYRGEVRAVGHVLRVARSTAGDHGHWDCFRDGASQGEVIPRQLSILVHAGQKYLAGAEFDGLTGPFYGVYPSGCAASAVAGNRLIRCPLCCLVVRQHI